MPVPDAHCHLDQLEPPEPFLQRARAAGVDRMLALSEGLDSCKKTLDLKRRYPDTVLAGLGIHPMFSVRLSPEEAEEGLAFIKTHLAEADALGEVGLDYKWARTEEERAYQNDLLTRMLEMAAAEKKPVNLHSRYAQRQTLERAVAFTRETGLPALMHWFTASKKLIRICEAEGIFVSAGPSVLFEGPTQEVVLHIPEQLLLVETDSPVPFGGEPAEPAWAARVCARLAELRGADPAAFEQQINENFARYLGKGPA
jgi:TatD DNase family protein